MSIDEYAIVFMGIIYKNENDIEFQNCQTNFNLLYTGQSFKSQKFVVSLKALRHLTII